MGAIDRIEYNPRVCNGRPVIRGTRIPVSVVLERIASAESWTELLEAFPELEREDIEAVARPTRQGAGIWHGYPMIGSEVPEKILKLLMENGIISRQQRRRFRCQKKLPDDWPSG